MDELQYLFKHALAQEVTYQSILLRQRKEQHLAVATAIESVFSEKLHEFYGMLAFHFSRAEEMIKAEEYLIKAGQEASKATASNEALNYYRDALALYFKKRGNAADPEKVGMLEKNIGLALFNKGHMAESVKHFDKALACFGEKAPKNSFVEGFEFLVNFLRLVKHVYWPSKKAKKSPSERDIEIINLMFKRTEALS